MSSYVPVHATIVIVQKEAKRGDFSSFISKELSSNKERGGKSSSHEIFFDKVWI